MPGKRAGGLRGRAGCPLADRPLARGARAANIPTMSKEPAQHSAAVARFRELHQSGCFLLPNPWDPGSAVYLASLGYQALATTSAGFAWTQALPDDVSALSLEQVLGHFRDISAATGLPVNADFQTGFAVEPEGVAENITRCVRTGVAGISIEDSSGDPTAPLFEFQLALERIRAARAALDASGSGVLLTARCEAFLVGVEQPFKVAMERLEAFAAAGADCLYAPRVMDAREIGAMIRALHPKPVNILMAAPHPELNVARLAEMGARRISVGGALARTAWAGFMSAAKGLLESGEFDVFEKAAPGKELDGLFSGR